jgi:hypothetical protein
MGTPGRQAGMACVPYIRHGVPYFVMISAGLNLLSPSMARRGGTNGAMASGVGRNVPWLSIHGLVYACKAPNP